MKSKKVFKMIFSFFVLIFIFSSSAVIITNGTESTLSNIQIFSDIEIYNQNLKSPNDWTFLVYLDADNNLESAGIDDFLEMASVGSDANIHIVVQFDRISGYDNSYNDWTTTKRFHITPGMTPTSANALLDLGEVNMGLASSLSDFITWGTTNYPSVHYALILWNHGSGWKGQEEAQDPLFKGVCWDDTDYDYLDNIELKSALIDADVELDLIGFDACLMAMAEIDYQIRAWADVRVASEEVEPGDGYPYDTILSDLISTPTMNALTLGSIMVNDYIAFYGTSGGESLSAVDLLQENTLITAINTLSVELSNQIVTYYDDIKNARLASEASFWDPDYIDLYDFADEIWSTIPVSNIQNAAQNVMNTIISLVINEAHGSAHPDYNGISIYFPEKSGYYDPAYEWSLDFTADLFWDEFLQDYYGDFADDNYEENDYYYDAYNLSLYEDTWLSTINGVGIQADDDWYEIYVDPGDLDLQVTVTFTHSQGDIDLAVYDASIFLIAESYSTTDNEYIDITVPSAGTYYLLIHYEDAGNNYDLWWDDLTSSPPPDDNYEENDYYYEAYNLSSYEDTWLSTINGLGVQLDDDWYEINIKPDYEQLIVDLTFNHTLDNLELGIYDYTGVLITQSTTSTDNEHIDYILPNPGIYYIKVYGNNTGNVYNLCWNSIILDDNYEENDDYPTAYDLTAHEDEWLDKIDGAGVQADEDWYKISISEGYKELNITLLFFNLQGNIDLALHDSSGHVIVSSATISDNELIEYRVDSSGIYFIKVYGDNSGNSYTLMWSTSKTKNGGIDRIPGYNLIFIFGILVIISIFPMRRLIKRKPLN